MCLMPAMLAIEFSILRATSVSSCAGAAPGSDAVTITVGRSMSGKFWIFIALKLISPSIVRRMNSSNAGIGLRIDQVERFICDRLLDALCHRDHVAVGKEADAGVHHRFVRLQAFRHFDAITFAATGFDLGERDP